MIARLAEWFARTAVDHRLLVLVVTGLLVVASIYPALTVPFEAAAEIWFLENDPALTAYDRFHETFGNDEFVLLTVESPEGTVFRNDILASILRVTAMLDTTRHVGRVVSLARYETIHGREDEIHLDPALSPLPMSREDLKRAETRVLADRLAPGRVVSADGRIAIVLAEVQHHQGGFDHKSQLVNGVKDFLERERLEHGIDYVFTGSDVMDQDIYEDSRRDLKINVPLLYVLITLFLILTIRSVPGTLFPLAVVFSAVALDRSFFMLLGWKENSLATMIPLVLTAVGVADSVHIVVQYFTLRGRGQDGPTAARESVRRMFKPCLLTSLTTSVGFLSLLVAPLAPLQQMGALTSIGVTLAFLLSVLTLPAALSYLGGDYTAYARRRETGRFMRVLEGAPAFIRRRRWAVLVSAGLVTLWAAAGLAQLKVESNAIEFFRKNDPIRMDCEYVEEHVGGVGNLEVVVRSKEPGGIRDPEVLRAMDELETWLESRDLITDSFSVVEYLKTIHQAMNGGDPAFHRVPESTDLVAQYLLLYGASSPVEDLSNLVDLTETSARVGSRVKFASSRVYRKNVEELREFVAATFPDGVDVELTGLMMLYKNMGDYIITSQIRSFLVALVIITITMAVAFRSWRAGLLSMIPNVWPIAFTLGFMGWMGIRLDMVNAMVAAVAIGIAVDDTVHFLSKYIEAIDEGNGLFESISYAFHVSGRAIVFTSIILLAAFSVILRSVFLPSVYFAGLSALCILMALVADLFILPAIFLRFRPLYGERTRSGAGRAGRMLILAGVLTASMWIAVPVTAEEAGDNGRGRSVMQAVEDESGDIVAESADITMILRDKAGNEVTRRAWMAFLAGGEGDDEDRSLIRFTEPPDLRGTAFLTFERPGNDDQWLYLPALGRVKRIAASKKSGSFVGTQFTYEDLSGREVDEYRHRHLGEVSLDGETTDIVESVPHDANSGYSRIVSWVSRDRAVILQVEYYDRHGELLKTSRSTGYHQPDGRHWRFESAVMRNLRTGKSTEIRVQDWKVGVELDPALFTVEALERDS